MEQKISSLGGGHLSLIIRPEWAEDEEKIEKLAESAFGPGRFARAAFRLREGVAPARNLSFVATVDNSIVGSVKLTPIAINGHQALILGPLMTTPEMRKLGIGRELMNRSLIAAKKEGHEFVVLVGDLAYYGKFGFKQIPHGRLCFSGPADPARILVCELKEGVGEKYHGQISRWFG